MTVIRKTKEGETIGVMYHVFTDSLDYHTDTLKEAKEIYRTWKKEGYTNLRIYKDVETPYESGEFEEYYVQGCGDFPW